ncbi:hypothetical protein AAMO2058_001695200 [Amorphochlora amoebiformis]
MEALDPKNSPQWPAGPQQTGCWAPQHALGIKKSVHSTGDERDKGSSSDYNAKTISANLQEFFAAERKAKKGPHELLSRKPSLGFFTPPVEDIERAHQPSQTVCRAIPFGNGSTAPGNPFNRSPLPKHRLRSHAISLESQVALSQSMKVRRVPRKVSPKPQRIVEPARALAQHDVLPALAIELEKNRRKVNRLYRKAKKTRTSGKHAPRPGNLTLLDRYPLVFQEDSDTENCGASGMDSGVDFSHLKGLGLKGLGLKGLGLNGKVELSAETVASFAKVLQKELARQAAFERDAKDENEEIMRLASLGPFPCPPYDPSETLSISSAHPITQTVRPSSFKPNPSSRKTHTSNSAHRRPSKSIRTTRPTSAMSRAPNRFALTIEVPICRRAGN